MYILKVFVIASPWDLEKRILGLALIGSKSGDSEKKLGQGQGILMQ